MVDTGGTRLVDIDSLQPHPENARQGDLGEIMVSMARNGWYGSVIVQHKKRGRAVDDTIIAGEHRWKALRLLQSDGIDLPIGDGEVRHLDYAQLRKQVSLPPPGKIEMYPLGCDDDTALRIMLADNGTNDKAGYDDGKLAELLQRVAADDPIALLGTAYDGDDLDDLLKRLDTSVNVPTQDRRTVAERAAVYNDGDVRQIVIIMSPDEFNVVHDTLERAMELFEVGTHSEAAVRIFQAFDAGA